MSHIAKYVIQPKKREQIGPLFSKENVQLSIEVDALHLHYLLDIILRPFPFTVMK